MAYTPTYEQLESNKFVEGVAGPKSTIRTALHSGDGEVIDSENSLPVKISDGAGRSGTTTVFGDSIFAQRVPTLSAQFYYALPGNVSKPAIVSTGTIDQNNAMLNLQTGTAADGFAQLTSSQSLRYVPGYEAFLFETGVFTAGVPDSFQREGLYTDDDGFFVGYEGETFGFTRRRAGVDNFYPLTTEDLTFADGTVLDPTKGNIFRISYGFLGFATITLEAMNQEGGLEVIKKIKWPNTSTETHIQNTYLPVRAEVGNTGNTTNLKLSVGSICAGIADGASADITGRVRAFPAPETAIINGTLIVYRNKTDFTGKENRITARLKKISAAVDGNKPARFTIYRDPAYLNTPTWTDVETDGSIMEYSIDASIDVANSFDVVDSFILGRLDSINDVIDTLNLFLVPGQSFGIQVQSQNTTDANFSYTWNEEF
jgi:hypothetical protein